LGSTRRSALMRQASPQFVAAWERSPIISVLFEVVYDGAVIGTVEPVDWKVSFDRSQLTMGRLTAVFMTPDRRPGSPDDLLHPWGREIRVWVGVLHQMPDP